MKFSMMKFDLEGSQELIAKAVVHPKFIAVVTRAS